MARTYSIPSSAHLSFVHKVAAGGVLVILSDVLFFGYAGGSVLGVFVLAWLAALVLVRPSARSAPGGRTAIAAGAVYAAVLIDDPSVLGLALFLVAIGSAALLPRHTFDHAGRWAIRLLALGIGGFITPLRDVRRVTRLFGSGARTGGPLALQVALPLVGGGVFLALFATANPVLSGALGSIRTPHPGTVFLHVMLLALTLVFVWPTFRPRSTRLAPYAATTPAERVTVPAGTMITTLVVFNAVFALENALDIMFLWNGAALPDGVTLADYAHRGAYTLIVTALLAALFVLLALRPGSAAARHPAVRKLVLAWIAQNVFLVASSMLRLADYIDVYSLTTLRISALLWMVLVAIGLVLVCWRFMAGRGDAWLINANVIAAACVLTGASVVDLRAVAAHWNVRHRDGPAALDLCYLSRQGSSALLPLIALRDAPVNASIRERAAYLSQKSYDDLRTAQSDWQSWTWRDARRLARAEAKMTGNRELIAGAPHGRRCDGTMRPPPPPSTPVEPQYTLGPPEPAQVMPEVTSSNTKNALPPPAPLTPEQNP